MPTATMASKLQAFATFGAPIAARTRDVVRGGAAGAKAKSVVRTTAPVRRCSNAPLGCFRRSGLVVMRFENVPTHNPYGDDESSDEEDEDASGGGRGRGSGGDRGSGGGGGGSGGDGEGSSSIWARIAFMWTRAMRDRPMITKMKTTLILSMLGDFIAQRLEKAGWDARRSLSVGLLAAFWIGPNLHGWYLFLSRVFPGGNFAVLKKLAADQLLFSVYLNSGFLFGLSVFEGARPQDAFCRVRKQIPRVMLLNWKLWPAAQFINFTLVPPDLQIVWINLTALVWNVVLSLTAHA
uniref:Peroxisomal membrane protein MPV17 n=1 Tax=Erythrolobus australicus TaxID=1077150 RepID=A0A7S1TK38_9RHOD|mmetsp:Transcript_1979/g.5239  ORF Transcript_1979/g.5239 Transcript_1979/m.5239 type:complete len:294 (+) Transcript_1979:155-1036(+)